MCDVDVRSPLPVRLPLQEILQVETEHTDAETHTAGKYRHVEPWINFDKLYRARVAATYTSHLPRVLEQHATDGPHPRAYTHEGMGNERPSLGVRTVVLQVMSSVLQQTNPESQGFARYVSASNRINSSPLFTCCTERRLRTMSSWIS